LELRVSRTFLDQLRLQLLRPWIPNSTRCQSRKGPPTFPWCQKVGAPFRSNSVVCVKQYPAGKGLHPAETRSARVSRPARTSATVLSPLATNSRVPPSLRFVSQVRLDHEHAGAGAADHREPRLGA